MLEYGFGKTFMTRRYIFFCLWLAISGSTLDAFAGTWPRLESKTPAQCTAALQIARLVYASDEFYLYAPPVIPANFPAMLVLKPQSLDISGGDGLQADESIFDKLPKDGEGAPRSIYWQKQVNNGHRLAIVESDFGWRGDTYSLFALRPNAGSDELRADIHSADAHKKFSPIIANGWRPPLLFRDRGADRLWLIDVGRPYQFLGDWYVYIVEPSGVNHRCTIRFRPAVKKAITLLPAPVRELARLLDQTMGQGQDEGTLQPTARLRINVEHTWANAAQRPWVLDAPYNTRAEVDAGLQDWSEKGKAYRKIYKAIQHQIPVAERSLAQYYQRHFGRSAAEAKKVAAYVIDIALRSHYVFHSASASSNFSDKTSSDNPWRKPK